MGGKSSQNSTTTQTSTSDDTLNSILQQIQQQSSTTNQNQQAQSSGTTAQQGTSDSTGQGTSQNASTTQGQQTQQGTTQQTQQGTGNTTSTTNLTAGQQPNVDLLLSGARDAYATGNTDPLQAQARQQAVQYAQGQGANLVGQAIGADQQFLDPSKIYDVANDKNYQNLSSVLTQQANKNLMEQILPQVRAGGVATGNLGGSADAILQGQAIGDSNAGLTQALAGLQDSAVNRNLAAYQAAQGRVGTNYNLGLAPSSTIEQAGAANIADRNSVLGLLQSLTGGAGTYGGTNTQATTQQGTQSGVNQQTGTSQGSSQEQGSTTQAQQNASAQTGASAQNSSASTQTQVDELLKKLGLTDTTSSSDASGTSNTTGKGGGGSGGITQGLGSLITLASLFF